MLLDPAIVGADPMGARSFSPTFTTSASSAQTIACGGYSVIASQDMWLALGDDTVVAAVPGTSQPSAVNNAVFCPQNQVTPLNVKTGGLYLSMIGVSASGTASISGPLAVGSP